jgi:glycosyltransferase involved in cell wall biosynthesis
MNLTSVIIATYNMARHLPDAIRSALDQENAEVEVIVVDDGSNDDTPEALLAFHDARLRTFRILHSGPALARNFGIDQARGEFVQFLDADDTLEVDKVAVQLAAFDNEIGWTLCDTTIIEIDGRTERASQRYDYASKQLGGWIAPLLSAGNFIPIHAPLVRREVLGDIRFEDRALEDWHFWHAIASWGRVRYVDIPLCTYRKRRGGRNAGTPPGVEGPLRLNLGCGSPGTRSWHPMPGFVNLDKALGWRFEDGLHRFPDGTVAGITISHALMYVELADWPLVCAEFARARAGWGDPDHRGQHGASAESAQGRLEGIATGGHAD